MQRAMFLMFTLVLALLMTMSRPAYAQVTDPAAIVQAEDMAHNAGNVDAALALFADNAVVTVVPPPPDGGLYTGKAQIRGYLQRIVAGHIHTTSTGYHIAGDRVTWQGMVSLDRFRKVGVDLIAYTAEAVVQAGRIMSWTATNVLTPAQQAKLAAGGPPPSQALPTTGTLAPTKDTWVLTLVGLGMLGFGWVVRRRRSRRA